MWFNFSVTVSFFCSRGDLWRLILSLLFIFLVILAVGSAGSTYLRQGDLLNVDEFKLVVLFTPMLELGLAIFLDSLIILDLLLDVHLARQRFARRSFTLTSSFLKALMSEDFSSRSFLLADKASSTSETASLASWT